MFEGHSRDEVEAFINSSAELRRLYHRHRELDKQVLDAELGVLPVDDATLHKMKREKLHAKDQLTRLFERQVQHAH